MNNIFKTTQKTQRLTSSRSRATTGIDSPRRQIASLAIVALVCAISGCAACNPMQGVPARFVPEQFRAPTRSGKRTIDLSLLRQTPPAEYQLDSGDILAVYIENVLGKRNEVPPVYVPDGRDDSGSPALGYPIPVRSDGKITLPLIPPLSVRGMTIPQLEQTLRDQYTKANLEIKPGRERIFVSLQKPRQYRVLVIRQEAGADLQTSGGGQGQFNLGVVKRGSGQTVSLPAYENDVLHALAASGGLPGLDAENAIYIIRRRKPSTTGCSCQSPEFNPSAYPNSHMLQSPQPMMQPTPQYQPGPTYQPDQFQQPGPIYQPSQMPNGGYIQPPAQYPSQSQLGRPQPATIQLVAGEQDNSQQNWGGFVTYPVENTSNEFLLPPSPQMAMRNPLAAPGASDNSFNSVPNVVPDSSMQQPVVPMYPSHQSLMQGPQLQQQYNIPAQPMLTSEFHSQFNPGNAASDNGTMDDEHVIRIPIRLGPGNRPQFNTSDVILEDGDIVFIESRETEIFYTGGLLGGGQFTLPRDYDLDVLGAISIAQSQGQTNNGVGRAIGGVSALNSDVTISASHVIVLRQLPNGTQIPIEVDLYKAVRNPDDRIVIQPGDYVMLQYTKAEAFAAFIERHLIEGALFGIAGSQLNNNNNN